MPHDLLIAGALSLFVLIVLRLRTNIALGILALTAGYVLNDLVATDIFNALYRNTSEIVNSEELINAIQLTSVISITIVLLPAFLVLFRFKNFQPGRLLVHIAPAGAFALLAMLFILISLPMETQALLREESFVYAQFEYFQAVIVIGAVAIAIFDLMAHEKKLRRKNRKRRSRSKADEQ